MNSSNGPGRNRRSRGTYTTDTGKSIKLNRSLSDRRKASKADRAAQKATYLSTLPKNRFKRVLYRLHPKRIAKYWFSREGALMALKLIGIAIVIGFFLTVGMFAYFRKDLPKLKDIAGDNIGGSISYYDSTGTVLLWQDYDAVKRIPVQSDQISPYMKDATVAIEDRGFYKEGAFDVRGIARAASHDALGGGGSLQGGSTITQQLVKLNENWTDDRTITRKVKELILAVEVEREYTKDQILSGYLNIAPYGGIEYGVEAAANDYFHTTAANLTLAQASMLAAIPQSPSYYSPYGSTVYNSAAGDTFSASALLARQHYILNQMATQGYITQAQANTAIKVNVLAEVQPLASKYQNIQDPYFVLVAKQKLEDQFGSTIVNRGGLKVITTLNLGLQQDANEDVAKNAANVASTGGDDEAMAAENVQTGQVVAIVGGEDFNNTTDGQLNFANLNILPGSSVKPFVYSTLINNNTDVGAGSVIYDVQQPIDIGGTDYYPCTNKNLPLATVNPGNCLEDYDFLYPGAESLRYALAGSRNVPAIKAVLSEDPTDTSTGHVASINLFIKTFDSMMGDSDGLKCYRQNADIETAGQSEQDQCYAAAGIGDGAYDHIDEQVNGDSTLARLGQEIPETYFTKVTDADNKVLYQWTQPKPTQAIKTDTAYIIDNILSDPKASYLPTAQKFQNYDGWDIAVKTGTQNNNFDGLMTAWTTQYAVVSWVGYHTEDKSLEEGHMEDITEPLTRTWIEQALTSLHIKPVNWTQPSDIKTLPGFVQRSHIDLGDEEPGPTDELYPSWYTGKNSGSTGTATLDKVSGFVATTCTPSLAKETLGGADDSSFSIDIFYPKAVANEQALEGGPVTSTSSTQTDNVHNCNDSPPTVTVTAPTTCDNSCNITVTATQGTHALSGGSYTTAPAGTVKVDLNGTTISNVTIPSSSSNVYSYSFPYTPTSSGSGTLTATVTDSVLYTGSSTTPINYSGGGSAITISSPQNNSTSTSSSIPISWNGGAGTYTVYLNGAASTACSNVSGTSCTVTLPNPGTYTLSVSDSDGDNSNTVSVTGP